MEWMMAHPWMTFFLLAMAIEAAFKAVYAICEAIISTNSKGETALKEKGDNADGVL